MTTLFVVIERALARIRQKKGSWEITFHLVESRPQCLAVDPRHPRYVYCGTFDQGLWRSSDGGISWEQAGAGISSEKVMSVAVSAVDQAQGAGLVYAGTEPSALFRSEDQGQSWQELTTLRELPSASTWSFPPRPWTSHIRWITPDPLVSGRVFAAAEAGALVRTLDGGQSWEDRRPDGPFDTHTLVMSPLSPARLYSAAGDGFLHPGQGFVQSDDSGDTWYRPGDGLEHHYLWSVAADSGDPETLVISAAAGPRQAHDVATAESTIYRRSRGTSWQRVHAGLPAASGLLISVVAASPGEPGVFYAGNNRGIFRSTDAGMSWETVPVPWSGGPEIGRVHSLVAVPD